jgi:hypothetical protein
MWWESIRKLRSGAANATKETWRHYNDFKFMRDQSEAKKT